MAFQNHNTTCFPMIHVGSPFLFNLPPELNLDNSKRNFFDNIWSNDRKSTFPSILTKFGDYLHFKNIKALIYNPVLKPQTIETFLELHHSNKILLGTIVDLEQKIKIIQKEDEN